MRRWERAGGTLTRQPVLWTGLSAFGVLLLLGSGLALRFGAALAATSTISTCDAAHLTSALGAAASGDTLQFGCGVYSAGLAQQV